MEIMRYEVFMKKRFKISRKTRSWMYANIILANDLFNEFKVYKLNHPSIKSEFRLANLFLLNKKLRWNVPEIIIHGLNMDNLEEYYYA